MLRLGDPWLPALGPHVVTYAKPIGVDKDFTELPLDPTPFIEPEKRPGRHMLEIRIFRVERVAESVYVAGHI